MNLQQLEKSLRVTLELGIVELEGDVIRITYPEHGAIFEDLPYETWREDVQPFCSNISPHRSDSLEWLRYCHQSQQKTGRPTQPWMIPWAN